MFSVAFFIETMRALCSRPWHSSKPEDADVEIVPKQVADELWVGLEQDWREVSERVPLRTLRPALHCLSFPPTEEFQAERLLGQGVDENAYAPTHALFRSGGDVRLLLTDRNINDKRLIVLIARASAARLRRAWLMMVSMQIAVLPVHRLPTIIRVLTTPIGIIASIAIMPVCTGCLTDRAG